jgi:hypothetical protein
LCTPWHILHILAIAAPRLHSPSPFCQVFEIEKAKVALKYAIYVWRRSLLKLWYQTSQTS